MFGEKFIPKYLDKIANKITYKHDLNDTLFFYVSSVTKMLELRSGYFEDYYEAYQFADYVKEIYDKLGNIPYACYVNGKLAYSYEIDDVINSEVARELEVRV